MWLGGSTSQSPMEQCHAGHTKYIHMYYGGSLEGAKVYEHLESTISLNQQWLTDLIYIMQRVVQEPRDPCGVF